MKYPFGKSSNLGTSIMLSLDFSRILKKLPDRTPIWNALQAWSRAHPKVNAIPVIELMSDLQDQVKVDDLLDAIDALVSRGEARKVYRVMDPQMKVLLPKRYKSWGDVPEKVENNSHQIIEISPQDVATVLEGPE